MNYKIIKDIFKTHNYKFIIKTHTTEYNVCGKTIIKKQITKNSFYLKTKCDELKLQCNQITSIKRL